MRSRHKRVAGFIATVVFAGTAAAQDRGFYAGLALGQSNAKNACAGISVACDQKDTAWKIFGGYQFGRHLATELGYTDLGRISAGGSGFTAQTEVTGFELVGVGSLPLGERFSVYGKLGPYFNKTDSSSTRGGGSSYSYERSNHPTFGFGIRFEVVGNLAVRAEWQRYVAAGGTLSGGRALDFDATSLGLVWKFR